MYTSKFFFLLCAITLGYSSCASSLPPAADDNKEKDLSTVTKSTQQDALIIKSIDLSESDLAICKEIIAQIKADENDSVDHHDQLSRVSRHTSVCNPGCQNNGVCRSIITHYCSCRAGYSGPQCQYRNGRLRIYAKYATVQDRDGFLAGESDPYVRVTAYTYGGSSSRRTTRHIQGDNTPHWYQWLDFGSNNWQRYNVEVFDRDPGSDDRLSGSHQYYTVRGRRSYSMTTYGGGRLYFESDFN